MGVIGGIGLVGNDLKFGPRCQVRKVSELSTHSVILKNVEKIPIKWNEELTFSELYSGSLSQ